MRMHTQTISAIATSVGEGGIGIVRLSGDKAFEIANNIFVPKNKQNVEEISTHRVTYGKIVDKKNDCVIDEALLLTMHGPHSYTCEDVVELHCHGGATPLRNVLSLTLREGARLAEPGEFTKRAFLNGRLDLSQAQAVIDVIRSKTDASLRMAVGHLSGEFSEKIREYRYEILRMIAHLEAAIDFPEDDIDEIATDEVRDEVSHLKEDLEKLLATAKTGRVLREGLETAIIGKPNVGKSSLLNAILRESRAIVTDVPGTTRDSIEEYANFGGIPLKIIDTAGIRETEDVVEKIGVEKSRDYIKRADLILVLLDMARSLSAEDEEILSMIGNRQAIVLLNKSDLKATLDMDSIKNKLPNHKLIKISTVSGTGLDELEKAVIDMVYCGQVQQGEGAFVNNVRQAEILRLADQHLQEVLTTIDHGMSPDFIVIDLRAAWETLGEITGDTVGEDIIDQIFSQFCIGK
uniref:tRNA uridine-5-carboxymethylaminomethyl(34) synthesis GTPase MnmE n=1 Tax=Massilibacillus massiliensis TaxID=1806837 RepID=UPI000AAE4097|nr:tRNA uridine-5-carboxymethylaminomethyl(34) synthesis GTPase MnmE [Massilibacillus massiliensis]